MRGQRLQKLPSFPDINLPFLNVARRFLASSALRMSDPVEIRLGIAFATEINGIAGGTCEENCTG
jgi:hypothetical protein